MNSRRTFLKTLPLVPAAVSLNPDKTTRNDSPIQELKILGKIKIVKPKEIRQSPFGIGCETLDRALWDPKEVYPWMDNLSVKWARLQTGWARVEQEKWQYDWKWLDESVDGLIQRGFRPFFNVSYGNRHYTEGERGYHPLLSSEALAAWKKFVTALTDRYKDRISHYEIWNEPNLAGYWKPDRIDPANYVKLVRETAPVIRQQAPSAVIVGGVTSRLPYNYIRGMFDSGIADLIDIFSFHPYTTFPESYNERIVALRRLIRKHNPKIEIWQGENGFPSQPNSSGFKGEAPWTENVQAKIMLRRLLNDCALDITMSLWFLIIDLHNYPEGTDQVNYKGILRARPEISPKVAFNALQHLGSLVHGQVRTKNALIHLLDGNKPADKDEYNRLSNGVEPTLAQVMATSLETQNGTVLAYWSTAKALDENPNGKTHLFLWDWEDDGFQEPVLVDPLQGNIYEITDTQRFADQDRYRSVQDAQLFRQLPLQDYPLLIMEKSKVI